MPHKRSSWIGSIAVFIGTFVAWFAIEVLVHQENPRDILAHRLFADG